MRHLTIALALLAYSAPAAFAEGGDGAPLIDTFENGVNQGGWSYNPGDVIETSGGNPGAWLHQANADTFAPIWTSNSAAYSGDFRAQGISRMNFDARTDANVFGSGAGFSMSILIRDTKGTPSVDDDDYAYRVGTNIPLVGAGWKNFNFAVPADDLSAVPSGWKGGWVGDGENFRPGIEWSDVITSVDQVEIWWIDPAFFALFSTWNIGLDNVALVGPGSATVFNGTGINGLDYNALVPPTLGQTYFGEVGLSTPGLTTTFLAIGAGGQSLPIGSLPGFLGELLIAPPYNINIAGGVHSLAIPLEPSLLGRCVSTQGAAVLGSGLIELYNGLELVIGG